MKKIILKESKYGSKGENWNLKFIKYMKSIVTHPNYLNMPDAVKEDGKIQWEAPSNRSGGKYQFTHKRRLDWWRVKAKSIGINTSQNKWISKTAKKIHPYGEKPCKKCGRIMKIKYEYLNKNIITRFKKIFGENFKILNHETIFDILNKAKTISKEKLLLNIEYIFSSNKIKVPSFKNYASLQNWLITEYIPKEPNSLSPGAMSNAPDRFDGFHSFNRCCRGQADKGRSIKNLKTYSTDRRVFEFWSDGDWIAANKLMGLIKSDMEKESCADGGKGPPTSDHIGPLSLGFSHRPEFKLLSRSANSAKNNRMFLDDLNHLIKSDQEGKNVISWYAKPLWDSIKFKAKTEEETARISKILRDNQRVYMKFLYELFKSKKYFFLTYLLELNYANYEVNFINLSVKNFITNYEKIKKNKRETKYSLEQKARRIRVAFNSLEEYGKKQNRHSYPIKESLINIEIKKISSLLSKSSEKIRKIDNEFKSILSNEQKLRNFSKYSFEEKINIFEKAKKEISFSMNKISKVFLKLWNDERYKRK